METRLGSAKDSARMSSETSLEGWKQISVRVGTLRRPPFRNFLRGMETGHEGATPPYGAAFRNFLRGMETGGGALLDAAVPTSETSLEGWKRLPRVTHDDRRDALPKLP